MKNATVNSNATSVRIYSPIFGKQISFEASEGFARFLEDQVSALLQREKSESLLLETIESHAISEGIVAEFGVFSGKTINLMAERYPDRKIYGFDSFEGLSHDWQLTGSSYKMSRTAFATHGVLPSVPDNVELVQGFFDQSLPGFLDEHAEPFALMHVDCDIYESTKVIFDLCEDRIVSGTVIVFDEFFDYLHEARAFYEFVERTGRPFTWLGHGGDGGILFDSHAMNLARRNLTFMEKLINSTYRFVQHNMMAKQTLPHAAAVVMT